MSEDKAADRGIGRNIKLEELMHTAVGIAPDATGREALEILLKNNVPGVPVVNEEGLLVRFVTDGHLLASALPKYPTIMGNLFFVSDSGDAWFRYFAKRADRPITNSRGVEVALNLLQNSLLARKHTPKTCTRRYRKPSECP